MIIKFKLGEEVFWGDDNKKVTITNICPTIKGVTQSYEFYINDTLVREIEYKLYKSDQVFEDSKLRVDDEVYYISEKRGVKPVWYRITKVYRDEDYKDILYAVVDKDGNEKTLTIHNLSLYPNHYFLRH